MYVTGRMAGVPAWCPPTVTVGPAYSYSLTPSSSAQTFTGGARNFWSFPFNGDAWNQNFWPFLKNFGLAAGFLYIATDARMQSLRGAFSLKP